MAHWYNSTTKTYIIAVSKIFSDLHIKRFDDSNVEVKDIKVPLVYASKNKLSYILQKASNSDSISTVLPIIGFNIESLEYDPNRKMNSLNEIRLTEDEYILEGVPYNYNFSVNIKTKYQDDMWQILEQLLYYFKPAVTLNVKEFPNTNRDLIIKLTSTDLNFENNYDQDTSRELTTSLQLELKGFVYPSSSLDKPIYNIDVNFINNLNAEIVNISHDFIDPDAVTTITES